MDDQNRSYTLMRRVVAPAAGCAAALLFGITVASRAATEEDAGVIQEDAELASAAATGEFFQFAATIYMKHTATSASVSFAVPAGRRLVVENLSGRGTSTGIQSVVAAQTAGIVAVLPPKITSASWKWIGTTPTKVRFNAGNVFVALERPAPYGTCGNCWNANYVTVTGYLIAE